MKKKCDSAVLFPVPQNGDESLPPLLRQMSGPISFGLTNAYMFVAVLQNNQEALANLIAAILHIDRSEILSLEILNPIVLGEAADEKACVMDILVLLNGNIKQGLTTGRQEEANRLNSLIRKLAALGRTSDIVKGAGDPAYQAKLLEEFGL
ncbi:MAG: hypothetical protein Q4C65_07300 [Eubacteriales bacterium]|nr:hypothetical protein [Eubacteriales bacterium]